MRQGHQHRRGRNRNNGGGHRKGQNPLTRSFESNGPDVKIRGTPAHIAEKYISLARDAKSSGDEVLAENYLQHAEHYNRIILAFREQQMSQGGDMGPGMGQRFRVPQLQDPLDEDEFGEDADDFGGEQPPMARGNEPQPHGPHQPYEAMDRSEQRYEGRGEPGPRHHDRDDRGHGGPRIDDRQRRHGEPFRHRDRDRDRNREMRQDFQRQPQPERQPERQPDRQPQQPERVQPDAPGFLPERAIPPAPQPMVSTGPEPGVESVNGQRPRDRGEGGPRRRDRYQPSAAAQHEQPEFLRRPVRRPRRDATAGEGEEGVVNGAGPHHAPSGRDDGGSSE